MAEKEVTKHYNGEATVTFYPGNHGYFVDDPKFNRKHTRAGGGTSITGVMDKGKGLQMWPMWEMNHHLKAFFEQTTLQELVDSEEITIESILKAGRDAHTKKSDLGKSVGTDAHAFMEKYLQAMYDRQHLEEGTIPSDFPTIPHVEDIMVMLRKSYIRIINELKPKSLDDFKRLPKLIFKDIEIQQAIWNEATMLQRSMQAIVDWIKVHDIEVIGVEQTCYARESFKDVEGNPVPVCGKYDSILKITCSKTCGWCYTNGLGRKAGAPPTFTATYLTDLKTTNAPDLKKPGVDAKKDFVMGIYPEYMAQCGVYDVGTTEEFPGMEINGHLIFNASKQTGTFAPFFSFNREQNKKWALHLFTVKELLYNATKELLKAGGPYVERIKAA